jgi:DNA-binding NarL/FixJ family response regulator
MNNHVLIIDDHLLLSQLVADRLTSDGFTASIADLESDLDALGQQSYALVLLDLELGEGRPIGLDLIEPLLEVADQVLVMTGTTDDRRVAEALLRGASGVFRKEDGLDDLIASVHGAFAGQTLPPTDHERLRLFTAYEQHRRRSEVLLAPFSTLSPREGEVLVRLADGLTVSEIADETFTSVSTVRSHIKAIHRKLGVNNQLRAVAMMREAEWSPPVAC